MPDAMDEEPAQDGPSLELPSLGWRSKRRRAEDGVPEQSARERSALGHADPESPAAGPAPSPAPAPAPDPQLTEPTAVIDPAPAATDGTAPLSVLDPETQRAAGSEPVGESDPVLPRRERRPGGVGAAVLTGLVVGLGVVGLTWASLRLCEEVQGTSSCGDTGYGLLIGIIAAMIVVGGLLLRLLRVPEPGSTSFLGVGLTAALALLFLVDSLMDRPMVVVIPLLTAGTFTVAHWVTRTFTGPAAPLPRT